jgi:tetratricopeptide (TPR) repeat protein
VTNEFSSPSRIIFKVAVGFVVGALILLAGSLLLSNRYLVEQRQLAATGDVKGALEAARSAARLNPLDSVPLVAEASLLQTQGRPEEAAEVLQEAIRRDPANYNNRVLLGNLQMNQLNDPEAAVESYRGALERIPRNRGLISGLAGALITTGDLEGAKREYEKLRQLGGIDAQSLYNLRAHRRAGEGVGDPPGRARGGDLGAGGRLGSAEGSAGNLRGLGGSRDRRRPRDREEVRRGQVDTPRQRRRAGAGDNRTLVR